MKCPDMSAAHAYRSFFCLWLTENSPQGDYAILCTLRIAHGEQRVKDHTRSDQGSDMTQSHAFPPFDRSFAAPGSGWQPNNHKEPRHGRACR